MSLPNVPKKPVMADKRWTVKDKITQYKGLVKLSERDTKLLRNDRRVTERKQIKELQQLKKDIDTNRKELTNAIRANPQHHKIILSKNKDLQRTFQNHLPEETVEYLEHKNFNKRKLLDRLKFKTKNKLKELTAQKLMCGKLQNNSTVVNKSNIERMGEIISGKIQEANIKLEAALQIQHIYKNILKVLRKDKMNFDFLLNQLIKDSYSQSNCIYQATQIGQLATEYADDRKHELEHLRRAIKRDMKSRKLQIHIAEEQVEEIQNSLKVLVRKQNSETPETESISSESLILDSQLQDNIENVEKILESLQTVTCSSKFEDILPCIQDRDYKNKKMADILKKSITKKEALVNKINHAQSMYSHLSNATKGSTFEYMEKKIILKQGLKDMCKQVRNLKNTLEKKSNLVVKVRSIILHLEQLCRLVSNSNKEDKESIRKVKIPTVQTDSDLIYMPQQPEIDVFKIMSDLQTRLFILMEGVDDHEMENLQLDINTEKCFLKLIVQISRKVPMEEHHTQDALIMELEPKDATILTREFIKKESQLLVEHNVKPEWML